MRTITDHRLAEFFSGGPVANAHHDPMSHEVDRLLAQLGDSRDPGADDMIFATPAPRRLSTPKVGGGGHRGAVAGTAPARSERWLLALRVVLACTLAIAMTQWPYARACGWPLAGYLAAVLSVIVAGTWAATASWAQRIWWTHVLALLVILAGLAMTAERVLPRVGYAAVFASWSCPARR